MKFVVSLLAVVTLVQCGPIGQENESVLRSVVGNFVNCMNTDLSLCLKEKALLVTERVGALRQLKLFDGLTVINNAPEKEGRSYEPLSTDLEERRRQVSERLSDRAAKFMENAAIEISIDATDEDESRSIVEGRDKKKKAIKEKLKILLPLLAILKVKAVIIITIALVVIAASLLKLAILAKLVFLGKLIYLIKQLIAKHHHHHEHEEAWIPHEEHHDHHDHGHGWDGGWARTRNEANNLAYSAYNK